MSKVKAFSPDATAEAKHYAQQSHTWDRPQVQGFTIDGSTSLDLDDAIWIEETDTGATLSVHISDVSEAIAPGSELDKAAISRCHTRYFELGNDPMLPHMLSEAALSLQEGQSRPTLTIQLQITDTGEVIDTQLFESWLSSSKRFSYTQADYASTHSSNRWHGTIKTCQRWAGVLNKKRKASGAIGGMFSRKGVYFNENGQLSENPNARFHSHRIIEEFMIAANTAAARWLADGDHPALYRNHTAKAIAPDQDTMLQALLVLGSATAIRQRLQQWLNRAEYSPALIGHFALNLDAYGHFTSPIRRLADLINHRIIKARLRGLEAPYTKLDLSNLSVHINQTVLADDKKRTNHFKTKARKVLEDQLETPDQFSQLPDKEFTRLLKHAKETLPEPLVIEVKNRLTEGRLTIQDYYLLLLEGQDELLQQLVLKTLEAKPQDAASLMAMAVDQQEEWDSLEYLDEQQDSRFLSWATVTTQGGTQTTIEPGIATRKQTARHQACWLWLDQWLAQALVEPSQRVVPEPPPVEPPPIEIKPGIAVGVSSIEALPSEFLDGQNHVGTLNNLCQAMEWPSPTFDFMEHAEGFQCTCQLICTDQEIEGNGKAPKKKLAKQRAAMRVLEALKAEQ